MLASANSNEVWQLLKFDAEVRMSIQTGGKGLLQFCTRKKLKIGLVFLLPWGYLSLCKALEHGAIAKISAPAAGTPH